VVPEGRDDGLALVASEQAVIDEDADELVADGLVDKGATTEESTPPEDKSNNLQFYPLCRI
jgi:hypothetical protein